MMGLDVSTITFTNSVNPATHVFVIGVGQYRYLPGGSEPNGCRSLGLRQLSSPPFSAIAIYEWFRDKYRNPNAPLGSVEILISSAAVEQRLVADGAGLQVRVEAATAQNVRDAFRVWYARCHSDSANVACFFFCGHGVRREKLLLLLDDYGADVHNELADAIDASETYRGMGQCKARTQCFFFDCCQEVPFDALAMTDFSGRALIKGRVDAMGGRDAPAFYSTEPGDLAYGRTYEPTTFTQALIRALDGLGSRYYNGEWIVTTQSLFQGITAWMSRLARLANAPVQYCTSDGTARGNPIHKPTAPPIVPVTVGSEPKRAIDAATLSLHAPGAANTLHVREPTPGEWELELEALNEHYTVKAIFPTGGYTYCESPILVHPPDQRTTLRPRP
jgi:hypothetical protein